MQGIVNLEKDGSDLQPYTYMESDGIELKHNNLCSIYTIVATETFKPQSTPHCVRGSMCVDQLKQKNNTSNICKTNKHEIGNGTVSFRETARCRIGGRSSFDLVLTKLDRN